MATTKALSIMLALLAISTSEPKTWGGQGERQDQTSLVQDDAPPWLNDGDEPQLPAVAQTTPMDALVGIEPSEFERMIDGDPLDPEEDTLLKILFRVPQMGLDAVQRFVATTDGVTAAEIAKSPADYRALMFPLHGHAIRVQRLLVRPELAERYEFTFYYRVTVRLNDQSMVTVLTRSVPKHWPLEAKLNEPVRADALFLRIVAEETTPGGAAPDPSEDGARSEDSGKPEQASLPLFVSSRLAWFPQFGSHAGPTLNEGLYWLAKRRMDVSLWEAIETSDRKRLNAEDSECFYQLLATIKDSNNFTDEVANEESEVVPELEIFELLKQPQSNRGERFRVAGNIRRITRVEVEQPYFSERTGVEHYYQIDMFVKLKENQVVTMSTSDGGKGPEFKNKYPITVCVPELPDGLKPTDDINVQVSLHAHFFKLWAYPSQYVEEFDPNIRQIGPLFVGHEINLEESSSNPTVFTAIAAIVLIVSLGGAWLGAWALGKRDAKPIVKEGQDEGDPGFLKTLEEQDRAKGAD